MTSPVKSRRGRGYTIALIGLSFLLLAFLGSPAADPAVNGSAQGLAQNQAQGLPTAQTAPTATPTRSTAPAVLGVSPANRAVNVPPNAPVTVEASSGTLKAVRLVDARGRSVAGNAVPGEAWVTSELLRPSTTYTLSIAATGPGGRETSTRTRFTTLKPKVAATYTLIPAEGTVGVGMPVIVQFDSPVTTKARKAEVEKRVKVTTVPLQRGAWGWLDDRQLMWRPRTFWIPGTKVTVSARLHGVQTGNGKWITGDGGAKFTVGSSMVSSVNMKTHTLTVRRNGNVIKTIPVSTGKPGPRTETRSGTKVVIERSSKVVMDSATVGIPKGSAGYYKITTKWNLRVTWTGEFLHSAPWSVGAQGSQNVSHGCTNMAPANAEWMFRNSKMGDVVNFTGSKREFEPGDGIGVWVYDFHGWQARSALV